jgi:rare lipoprotein A (peptidoglycan hydrolase)
MSRLAISMVVLTSAVLAYDVYGLGLRPVSAFEEHPTQTGIASWYNEKGRLTADGEKYDPTKLTAAHRKLPFNTIIQVTNRENGRVVRVRVNDRGPYVKNRVLDLSEAAAKALDMKTEGVTPVKIEVLKEPAPPATPGSTLP